MSNPLFLYARETFFFMAGRRNVSDLSHNIAKAMRSVVALVFPLPLEKSVSYDGPRQNPFANA